MIAWRAAAAFVILLATSGTAVAAPPCVGFFDVDSLSPFCPDVEWMKNRGITLGCTGTMYCPTDPVNRLAMALFMNRLGNALEPAFLTAFDAGVSSTVNAGIAQICKTSVYAVSGYPRVATAVGMFYFQGSAVSTVAARFVYSLDAGATWNSFSPFLTVATNATGGAFITQSPVAAPLVLDVGQSVIFGVQTGEFFPTPVVSDAGCYLTVRLDSHTGTTSPFDAGPPPVQQFR